MNNQTSDSTNNSNTGNSNNNGLWIRVVYMILFLMVFSISETIVILTTVVAFVFRLFGKPIPAGVMFIGRTFARFIQQVILFLTFNTEQRPFPFSPWPDDSQQLEHSSPSEHP